MMATKEEDLTRMLEREGIDDFISSFSELPDINDIIPSLSEIGDFTTLHDEFSGVNGCLGEVATMNDGQHLGHHCENKYLESLLNEHSHNELVRPAPQLIPLEKSPKSTPLMQFMKSQSDYTFINPTANSVLDGLLTQDLDVKVKMDPMGTLSFPSSSQPLAHANLGESSSSAAPKAVGQFTKTASMTEAECKLMLIRQLTECNPSSPSEFAEVLLNAASQLRGSEASSSSAKPPETPAVYPSSSAQPIPASIVSHMSSTATPGRILPRPMQCIAPAHGPVTQHQAPGAATRPPMATVVLAAPPQNIAASTGGPRRPAESTLRQLIVKTNTGTGATASLSTVGASENVVRLLAATPVVSGSSTGLSQHHKGVVQQQQEPLSGPTTTVYLNSVPVHGVSTSYSHTSQPQAANSSASSVSSSSRGVMPTGSSVYGTAPTGRRSQQHNIIEKRYRMSINEKIDELRQMLPDDDSKGNKSAVLKRTIEYIMYLKRDNERLRHELSKCHQHHHGLQQSRSPDYTMLNSGNFLAQSHSPPSLSESSPSAQLSERELESPVLMMTDSNSNSSPTTPPQHHQSTSFKGKRTLSNSSTGSQNNKMARLESMDQKPLAPRHSSLSVAARGAMMLMAFTLFVFSPVDFILRPWQVPANGALPQVVSSSRRLFSWDVVRQSPPFTATSLTHVTLFWTLFLLQWSVALLLCVWLWTGRRRRTALAPERVKSVMALWQEHFNRAIEDVRQRHWNEACNQLKACRISLGYNSPLTRFHLALDILTNILANIPSPFIRRTICQSMVSNETASLQMAHLKSETLRLQLVILGHVTETPERLFALCLHVYNYLRNTTATADVQQDALLTLYCALDLLHTLPATVRAFLKNRLWHEMQQKCSEPSSWMVSVEGRLNHWENVNVQSVQQQEMWGRSQFLGNVGHLLGEPMSFRRLVQHAVVLRDLSSAVENILKGRMEVVEQQLHELEHFLDTIQDSSECRNVSMAWCWLLRGYLMSLSCDSTQSITLPPSPSVETALDTDSGADLLLLCHRVLLLHSKSSSASAEDMVKLLDEVEEVEEELRNYLIGNHAVDNLGILARCAHVGICDGSVHPHTVHLLLNTMSMCMYVIIQSYANILPQMRQKNTVSVQLTRVYELLRALETVCEVDSQIYTVWNERVLLAGQWLRTVAGVNPAKTARLACLVRRVAHTQHKVLDDKLGGRL